MGVHSIMTGKIRVIRATDGTVDEYGDFLDVMDVPGPPLDAHVEEVSDDEVSPEQGNIDRRVRRVYMLSLPDFDQSHKIEVASEVSPQVFSFSNGDVNDVISIEAAGGRRDHLQVLIKRVELI